MEIRCRLWRRRRLRLDWRRLSTFVQPQSGRGRDRSIGLAVEQAPQEAGSALLQELPDYMAAVAQQPLMFARRARCRWQDDRPKRLARPAERHDVLPAVRSGIRPNFPAAKALACATASSGSPRPSACAWCQLPARTGATSEASSGGGAVWPAAGGWQAAIACTRSMPPSSISSPSAVLTSSG